MIKDYARKDIVAIRNALIEQVPKLTTDWNDFNESDLGMVLIELMAGTSDLLNFYLDKQFNENFITTATQKPNVKKLLNLLGYKFKRCTSSTCTGEFSVLNDVTYDKNIIIPKYTQVSTSDSSSVIYYATKEEGVIKAGENSTRIPLIQGLVNTIYTSVGELSKLTKVILNSTKVAEKSVIVRIGNDEWTEVDDILSTLNKGKYYSVYDNKDDEVYILFDSNYTDYLPSDPNTKVTIQFLVSEGTKGIVIPGMITKIVDNIILDNSNITNNLAVSNLETSSGGSDAESIDEAVNNATSMIRTCDRAITLEDYNNILMNTNQIAKCMTNDWNNSELISNPYKVITYAVPKDSYELSDSLKTELTELINSKKVSSIDYELHSADVVNIDISINVYTNSPESKYATITNIVTTALTNYFSRYNRNFGEYIRPNNILNAVENCTELIEYSEIVTPSKMYKLANNQFPKLGSININILRS